jgi:hypothetical protein
MTRRSVRTFFALALLLGAITRALAWRFGPALYPDAQFQYVEPAWRRVTGFGLQTWEYREGLRSWVMPGYHGGWMALLHACGVRGAWIGRFLILHWAVASLVMVWAAYRSGSAIGRRLERVRPRSLLPDGASSGLLAAVLVATFPLLGVYSLEPLSELPSMIAFVAAMAFVADAVEVPRGRPVWRPTLLAGALLSFAACVRDANAPLALVPVAWLLVGRRGSALQWMKNIGWLALGAIGPVLLFGIVDALTWGGFLSSVVHHLRFNVIEHGAEGFGREPARAYFERLANRSPVGLLLLLVPALVGIRATWPYVGSAVALIALATSQPHKEERFVVLAYPLLLIAAGGVAGRWLRPPRAPVPAAAPASRVRALWGTARRALVVLGVLAVVVDGALHLRKFDYDMPRSRFAADAWIGAQPGVTGLLVDWPYFTGGYLWFGHTVPLLKYERDLLANALFSHVLMRKEDGAIPDIVKAGFKTVYERDGVVVLQRVP